MLNDRSLLSNQSLIEEISNTSKSTPLIQEIECPTQSTTGSEALSKIKDQTIGPKPKEKSVVKKGFLNKAKKSLYPPSGSTEGHAESAYSRLMNRSQVVDLSQSDPKVAQNAIHRHAAGLTSNKTTTSSRSPELEEDHGDFEFDRLCADLEPELGRKNKLSAEQYAMEKNFEKMASAFS